MKLTIAGLLFIFLGTISFAQDDEWNVYGFDSIVSVGLPGSVYERDSIVREGRIISLGSISDSGHFLVQRLLLDQRNFDLKLLTMPEDKNSLEQLYSNIISLILELDDIDFKSRETFEKNDLVGRKTRFEKKGDSLAIMEIDMVYLNRSIYLFSYSNLNGIDTKEKHEFFNAIEFNENFEFEQYYLDPTTSMTNWMWKLIIGFLGLSFFFPVFHQKEKETQKNSH